MGERFGMRQGIWQASVFAEWPTKNPAKAGFFIVKTYRP
jgi:hypothetical protein